MDCDKLKQEVNTMDNIKRNSLNKILSLITLLINSFTYILVRLGFLSITGIIIWLIISSKRNQNLSELELLGAALIEIFLLLFVTVSIPVLIVLFAFFTLNTILGIINYNKLQNNQPSNIISIIYNILSFFTYFGMISGIIYYMVIVITPKGLNLNEFYIPILICIVLFIPCILNVVNLIAGIKDAENIKLQSRTSKI